MLRLMHRRNDEGIAMISVIGIGFVLTLLATASLVITISNNTQAGRQRRSTQAFHTADAGFNRAVHEIKRRQAQGESFLTDPAFLEGQDPLTGTSYKVELRQPDSTRPNRYIVTSASVTSAGERRVVRAQVDSFSVWDFEFSGAGTNSTTGGNASIEGSSDLHGPFYVRGDFIMLGSGNFQVGPLYLKTDPALQSKALPGQPSGNLVFGDAAASDKFGTPAPAVVDCGLLNGPVDAFAEQKIVFHPSRPVPPPPYLGQTSEGVQLLDLALPVVDDPQMEIYYNSVDLNLDTFDGDPRSPSVGADDQRNGSQTKLPLPTFIEISSNTPDFSYGPYEFEGKDGAGTNPFGLFSWKQGTRTLHVDGSVFVDGNLRIGSGQPGAAERIFYEGRGTFIVNGKVEILNSFRPSDRNDFPKASAMGIVSNYTGDDAPSVRINPWDTIEAGFCSETFDKAYQVAVAVFGKRSIKVEKDAFVRGTLVGGELQFASAGGGGGKPILYSDPELAPALPPDLPGTERITQVIGFHELPLGAPDLPVPPEPSGPAQP